MTDTPERAAAIAVVDDEDVVLQTIRAFLDLETDYDVHTFRSPVEALDAMERTRIDLVVSDFLMPEMNGLQFLEQVKQRHPDTVRVLLTGYADKENAIQAINEVDLFQYLEKPWDNDQLLLVIRNGLHSRNLSRELQEKISEIDAMLRRHAQLVHRHERLRKELELARRVQETILPELPDTDRLRFAATYRPAFDVGGDFYDVISLDDGRVAVFVADTTGHGVQAALNTTLLKSAFVRSAGPRVGPADMLAEMNRALHDVLPSELFVAATLAAIDPDAGSVCVVNAGGPHPFRLTRSGGVDRVASNGFPLGAVGPSSYRPGDEVTVTMEPGERMLIYTDGLTEVDDGNGKEFGDAGLVDALGAVHGEALDRVGSRLLEAAKEFSGSGHEWDDVTIVAFERPA